MGEDNENRDYWRSRNPPKDYAEEDLILEGKRAIALRRLRQAVRNGTIERVNKCQICGDERKTQAHHWKGYDFPFDVWWLCPRCNNVKRGLSHDGSLTFDEARQKVITEYVNSAATTMRIVSNRERRRMECDACGIWVKRRNMEVAFGEMLLCPLCAEQLYGDRQET